MCRLLGVYGRVDGWQRIAMEFSKLAEFGKIPPVRAEPGHKDGWGVAASNAAQTAMTTKARHLGSAYGSLEYQSTIEALASQPHVLLSHVRKASPGIPVTIGNVHPFSRNKWAFIHNGTVYDPESLPREPSFELISDGSDSEFLFGFFLGVLSEAKKDEQHLKTLIDALSALTINHTSINCMLSNGSELIVIRDCQRYEEYLTLFYYPLNEGVIVCSEPIDTPALNPGKWIPLSNKSILRITETPPVVEIENY